MIKVEINSLIVDTKSGVSPKTGKPYSIREQEGWGFFFDQEGKPHPHPMRIRLMLDDQNPPYPLGVYQIDPCSFYPDRFGQVSCRVRLKPLVAAAKAAA